MTFANVPSVAASTSLVSELDVSLAMWGGLAALVVVMLVADLRAFGGGDGEVSLRQAGLWSIAWVVLALVFGAVLWAWQGSQAGSEYLAGYLLERSLSLDNIFVFTVIFSYFAVPSKIQPRVLGWGIALALVLRLVFILAGTLLLSSLHATFYAFGALLLYTAYKLVRHDDTDIEPEHNPALRLLRRRVPMSARYEGHRLISKDGAGRRVATPLVAVFVVIATTDLIFAVDSIPAIFAVTTEPFIVFAANAFAMIGLRALYFVLARMVDRFSYLSYGLSAILAFIGAKMLLIDVWHPPIWLSLAVIVAVLAITIVLSMRRDVPEAPDAPDALPEPARS